MAPPNKRAKNSEVAAIEDCKRRLRRELSRGDYVEAGKILNTLGNQQRLLGNFEDALDNHEQEVQICKMHNKSDRLGLAVAYRNIAEVYIDMKEPSKGISYVDKYLNIARELGNVVEEQRALITMGRAILLKVGDDEEGEGEEGKTRETVAKRSRLLKDVQEWFRKAYSLLVSDNRVKDEVENEKEFMVMKANNCQNLGVTLEMMGSSQALRWFEKAVEIGTMYGLAEYLYPCHAALCNIYFKLKEPMKALSSAKEALKAAVALGSISQETEAKLLEARASFFCHDIEIGRRILKKLRKRLIGKVAFSLYLEELDGLIVPAIKLSERLEQLDCADKSDGRRMMCLHECVADAYAELNLFSFAILNYLKAVEYGCEAGVAGRKLSSLYFSIAESYKDNEEFDKALEYYTKEMSLYEDSPDEKFKTQTHITQLFEKCKEDDETIGAHEEAIRLAELTGCKKKQATAHQNYGVYLKYIGDSRAESELKKSEEITRQLRQEGMMMDSLEDNLSDDGLNDDDEVVVDLDNLSSDGDSEDEESLEFKNVAQAKRRIAKRKNEAGETPLHIAAKKGDLNAVRKYLRQGFDVNARDTAGWTPLHEAANFGFHKVVKELLDRGAKVNDPGGHLCEGITPLHDALSNGHFEVVDVLLENGANVLLRDKKKNLPIDQLISWRNNLVEDDLEMAHQEYKRIKQILKDKMQQHGHPYTAEDEKRAVKMGQKRSKSPEFTLLCGSQFCPIPVRIANDSFDPDEPEGATKEYQNAMRALLRHPERSDERKCRKKKEERERRPISPGPRNALIPSELDVHEDWMIGDSQVEFRPVHNKRRKSRRETITIREEEDVDEDVDMDVDEVDVAVDANVEVETPQVLCRVPVAATVATAATVPVGKSDSQSFKRKREDGCSSRNNVLRLKIRVLDKLLLVPVDVEHQSHSIGWLCETASARYKQSYGVKPNLSLSTLDGALLSLEDSIHLVLGDGECVELVASVLGYDTPSATSRLEVVARELGLTPRPVLVNAVKVSEGSGVLQLVGVNLHGLQAKGLFLALKGSSVGLKELLLSGCCLFDEDLEELGSVLSSLVSLSRLDLSCNAITMIGVKSLLRGLETATTKETGEGVVFGLKELDLSLNPLGNDGGRILENLGLLLPNLQRLGTDYCNLSRSSVFGVCGSREDPVSDM